MVSWAMCHNTEKEKQRSGPMVGNVLAAASFFSFSVQLLSFRPPDTYKFLCFPIGAA